MLAGLQVATGLLGPFIPALAPGADILYWRHRWFSAWVEACQPSLVIEIGAGLSTRGQTYARCHPETTWVDLDLPGMVASRRQRGGVPNLPNYQLAAGDLLAPPLAGELKPVAPGSTVVLTEGVMDYLDRPSKRRAWQAIAQLLRRCGGGRYLCEVYPLRQFAPRLRPPGEMAGRWIQTALRRANSSLWFHQDEALAWLRDSGFDQVRILTEDELPGAGQAIPAHRRAFCLIEARVETPARAAAA